MNGNTKVCVILYIDVLVSVRVMLEEPADRGQLDGTFALLLR